MPAGAPILSAAQMAAAEAACAARGIVPADLMERAAHAVAREAARFAAGRPILVLAGPGNNGGDAYGAACLLRAAGCDVRVAALGEPRAGAAAAMRARWAGPVTSLADAPPRPFVIDGLFGTGMSRAFDGEAAARLCEDAFILSIDLPSGIDADRGAALGDAIRADVTLALGSLKFAHVAGEAASRCGHVLLDPIGIDVSSSARTIARPRINPPAAAEHKYSRGLVCVIGGAMGGAARLAAAAAARGGAGYVVLASDDRRTPLDAIVHREPDARSDTIADVRTSALLIGPGLGRDAAARAACAQALASDLPLVLDGDALALISIAALAARRSPTILTPHGGEFDALFGAGDAPKIARTVAAARASGAVVIHKGADTVIADPEGNVIVANPPSWLSTAGTGDVLAGLVAARLAVTHAPMRAACEAVWLHQRAAGLAGAALVADDLPMHVPQAIAECR
ncbi:NAD(P)H-hydrate dehydratase [Sphingomonas baiyangensis]|uniref:Bifunctional NAD(P)H-hydrate repair enzyme n=1 Tax=Sphingomonas baiyangensis TaxID=2572576 RepID=A0A4U1L5E5_9SPHN|nr:NAD(P)H-hydrate dehydratase [Sphingomonas baiyangensis]